MKIKFTTLFLSLLFILFALIIPPKALATNQSVEGWYKTTAYLKMRPEGQSNGTLLVRIPPNSIIYVERTDSKIPTRVITEYNGKTGSILNSGLVKTNTTGAPTSNQSTTISTTASSNTTTKKTTSTTKNSSITTSETQSYKTTYNLVMRDSNGKKITTIPAKSIVQVKGKDSKNPDRLMVTYNGQNGSVLDSGLVKVSTAISDTTSTTSTLKKSTTTNSNSNSKKNTTTTTNNSSMTTSKTQSYKTTYNLVMRDSYGKKIITIPAKSIIQLKGNDLTDSKRLIVTYNGKTGSVLNSGLQQITTKTSSTTKTTTTTTTTATTTSKKSTSSTNSTTTNSTYYARTKSECKLCDENGKTLKELKKNELVKVISSGKKGKVNVDWYGQVGFVTKNNIEKIDDGIFISIENQKETLIRNGNIIISTPIVTGFLGTSDTPRGVFSIIQMKKITNNIPVTLSGKNSDGTPYTSYVDYWMRIYRGIGIHDAYRWRSEYGGEIYKTDGSHGCINTPKKAMKIIYENSKIGLPVYVQ